MRVSKLAAIFLAFTVVLFILAPCAAWADDGATLYKTKCAACHGVDGAGKPTAKIPSLISDEAKAATDAGLTDEIANGGATKKPTHAFESKGVTADQVKMIVSYIRDLQKK
jgi:mono/diheme cytochrome c family protein